MGLGVGEGDGVGVGLGLGVGEGDGFGEGEGDGVGDGFGSGFGVGEAAGVGVGLGPAVVLLPPHPAMNAAKRTAASTGALSPVKRVIRMFSSKSNWRLRRHLLCLHRAYTYLSR